MFVPTGPLPGASTSPPPFRKEIVQEAGGGLMRLARRRGGAEHELTRQGVVLLALRRPAGRG